MTKKIYLGVTNNKFYITETGSSYTDQATFKEVSTTIHNLEDRIQISKDLDQAAKAIANVIGRRTRPFELYIGDYLQPIIKDIETVMKKYLPYVQVLKYTSK